MISSQKRIDKTYSVVTFYCNQGDLLPLLLEGQSVIDWERALQQLTDWEMTDLEQLS